MKLQQVVLALVVIVGFASAQETKFQCYSCTDKSWDAQITDPNCLEINDNTTKDDCNADQTVCQKELVEFEDAAGKKQTEITRRCAKYGSDSGNYQAGETGCDSAKIWGRKTTSCFCDEGLCNSADSSKTNALAILSVAFVSAAFAKLF